ncbi:LamG-like jellyroll fold domain-containing protein [Methanolobus halotolerans]|uniref:CARDB domain-containing protein n=1 Tax=Methanolobus halotolerans TaxID=2052935 RepID=A0A4E0QSL3_9EURY|nr:LamG-like jellyroll fold domain-containing protein [Methanolobus halotolerans]TGC10608.1 hypothetical protein CUN85_03715 [Methanolobus halotolerans]
MSKSIRYLLLSLLVTVILSTSLASASHLGEELVPNYGFEQWESGKPAKWTAPNSDWDIVQVGGEEGNYALMLETDRYTSPTKGVMESESIKVEEDETFLVTTWVESNNALETKVQVKGYDNKRKRWITLKTFYPSSDKQHVFITVPEDITLLCMRLEAGYVDDKDMGNAKSYFDELRIINPSVENAEYYQNEKTISKNMTLTIGSYDLRLSEAVDSKALIQVSSSGKDIDSGVLMPNELIEFKKQDDKYLVFLVDEVFVSSNHSEVRLSQLLAGRAASFLPTIHSIDEKGILLYLLFDENNGLETYDYSGENNHGSIHGAKWTGGMENYALEFDGIDNYVTLGNRNYVDYNQQFTISLWIKADKLNSEEQETIIQQARPDSPYDGLMFRKAKNNNLDIILQQNPDSKLRVNFIDAFSDLDWNLYTLTYDGSLDENGLKLYKNGNEFTSRSVLGNDLAGSIQNELDFEIGRYGKAKQNFKGTIDDIRIYDRALTPQEIKELMSKPLGLSGVSSYQSNMSLEKGMSSPVGNGFQIQYSDTPYLNLALVDGEQTQRYKLANISVGQTLFLKNVSGVPVLRLNVDNISDERLNLSDVWVANEKANVPVLKVKSLDYSEIRAYAPSTVTVTVINSGLKTYLAEGDGSLDLYLGEVKVDNRKLSKDLAPGETLDYSFELNSETAGENELRAVISTDYGVESSTSTVKIEPPVNPPVSGIPLYVKETESGIDLHMALKGPGIKGESWQDNAQISIGIVNSLGSNTFYEGSYTISGTARTIEVPYEEFYQGDERYFVTVEFREAENSVVAKIAGEDGIYDPPNNSYLMALLLVPLGTFAIRKKYFGKMNKEKQQLEENTERE